MPTVVVASPVVETATILRQSLSPGYSLEIAPDPAALLGLLGRVHPEFLFVDLGFLQAMSPEGEALPRGAQLLRQLDSSIQTVVLAQPPRIREAVELVKAGAANYLTYPLLADEVRHVIDSIKDFVRMESELNYLRKKTDVPDETVTFETRSPLMQIVVDKVKMVAATKTLVLLTGETGTGKSVIARLIHSLSPRKNTQFISVHCGAIPDTLIESELFGHEKGSFTGAVKRKPGKFEIASQGTLFLDEVGTITTAAQIKLLQVLQDKTFQRVGGEQTIKTEARIIAATNTDLKKHVESGDFRADLYYRLNVFPIEIPPLRLRKEDIPLLLDAFLSRLNKEYPKQIQGVHPAVMDAFMRYDWPGNVREMENLVERAFILETTSRLSPESFPSELVASPTPAACLPLDTSLTLADFREQAKEVAEQQYLRQVLSENQGKVNKSAAQAGISTRQLHKLLTKYSIKKEGFKSRTQ